MIISEPMQHNMSGNQYCFQKGFTLVEILIALAITSLVVAGMVSSKIRQQSSSISQKQAVEMQQTVRAAMFYMVDKIRMAGYQIDTLEGEKAITGTAPDSLTFSYRNDDGELIDSTYTLENGAELKANVNNDSQSLADNISSLVFEYFKADGSPTTNENDVRMVKVTITSSIADELKYSPENATRTLSATVTCRNIGL